MAATHRTTRPPRTGRRALRRRDALELLGAAGAALIAGCGSSSPTSPTTTTTATTTDGTTTSGGGTSSSACAVAPEETAGPYPDRIGMINQEAFYRQDVTEGQAGMPLTLALTVVNTRNACAAVSGAKVEIWQCNAAGNYSEYAQPGYDGTGQTYLRGLQVTNASGVATFRTIYPGWYMGRATHIHVEVFVNNASVKTTQIAFPESVTSQVYATGVYSAHGQNPTSNASDNIFADSLSAQLANVVGDTASGYTASLTIGIAV